jgi:3-hydroxyacyl-CoA dehydrogenase / enoyl-CoA hydratase / 3-hydroxybutyryl-CoA epimerase
VSTSKANDAAMFAFQMRGSVLLAVLDMPGRTMNVFSWALMDQLDALLDRVERDTAVKALVITSGKDSFLAGADLEMVRGFCDAGRTASRQDLHAMCGRLGRMFVRLEALSKPSVAAINGLALGGGLELGMACSHRIAADSRRVLLGVPEVTLGLLPGAGGTQRLPRLIGIEKGLQMLLNGQPVSPAEAKALGLIDDIAPADQLVDRALQAAEALARAPRVERMPNVLASGRFDTKAADAARHIARHYGLADETLAHYPAYLAIIRSTLEGANAALADGTRIEMDRFVDLMQDAVAGNMVTTLFLERQKSDKTLDTLVAVKDARFAVVGTGPAADDLRSRLATAKASIITPGSATERDVVIAASTEAVVRLTDLVLLEGDNAMTLEHIGVSHHRSKDYGSALEIVVPADAADAQDRALTLARQLRATPYLHAGPTSLLATLAQTAARAEATGAPADVTLTALAAAAEQIASPTPAAADVAAVVSGLFPAYAGGPYTFLRQCNAQSWRERRARDAARFPQLFKVPN